MIRVRFLPSFDDSLKDLSPKDRRQAEAAVTRLLEYFGGGGKPLGLGLRKLKRDFWEIRAGLDRRVLFLLQSNLATFVLIGNHDEIRRRISR